MCWSSNSRKSNETKDRILDFFIFFYYIFFLSLDLHSLVKAWFPISYKGRPSLKALAYGVAGSGMRRNSKNIWNSDWEFHEDMTECACVGAYAFYRIAHKLLKEMYVGFKWMLISLSYSIYNDDVEIIGFQILVLQRILFGANLCSNMFSLDSILLARNN